MRGRTEAIIAAVLATGTVLFVWVGAAVVGLVTLRKGINQGLAVLAWALLPAVVLAVMGDTGPLATLLGVTAAAAILRLTTSWQWALAIAVLSGLVTTVLLSLFGSEFVASFVKMVDEAIAEVAKQPGAVDVSALQAVGAGPVVIALLGMGNTITVTLCLMLARWWQAGLYNPGGFRAEFHQLRLRPAMAVGLIACGAVLSSIGGDYRVMALLFALPFVFAGFALVHGLAARKNISGNWLGLFYVGWLLLDPLKALLMVLALADSWLDFRSRLGKTPGGMTGN